MHLRELSQTKQALGSDVTLAIVTDVSAQDADGIFNEIWRQVYSFERRFSRFLPMSELSVFNRGAGIKNIITPEFRQLLLAAKELSIDTGGLFNPFILPALQRAGYVQSAAIGYENDVQEDHSGKTVVGIDKLTVGDDWATIPYGTALDMGGCGKGYLADQLGKTLQDVPVVGYWLSLGGDIATFGTDENGEAIRVNIQSANGDGGVSAWVVTSPLQHAGIATSGTSRRHNQDSSANWHHIIDPITLQPAEIDIRLATVCAPTALLADVLASCAVLLGSAKAPAFLKQHGATTALLQGVDSSGVVFEKKFGQALHKNEALAHA